MSSREKQLTTLILYVEYCFFAFKRTYVFDRYSTPTGVSAAHDLFSVWLQRIVQMPTMCDVILRFEM